MRSLPRIPIWQAPTGSIAGPELCAAVTKEGGVGAMGVTWTNPSTAASWVRQVRARTDGLFQVNFVLQFDSVGLEAVLEAGAPIVTFSWGDPGELARRVKSSGAFLGIQVVTPDEARAALIHEPDFLVCQGIEAGGHVQSNAPLNELLPMVVEASNGVPVVAAGGIATRKHIEDVLNADASGAMLGTRFVASQESRAHPEYKRWLIEGVDTVLTECFDIGWPNAKHRVLPNSTLATWQSAGSPWGGDRPGTGETVAVCDGEPIYRYEDTAPRAGMDGNIEAMCLYAGTGVQEISDLPSAKELIARLLP